MTLTSPFLEDIQERAVQKSSAPASYNERIKEMPRLVRIDINTIRQLRV